MGIFTGPIPVVVAMRLSLLQTLPGKSKLVATNRSVT
jgi:hypothetical protein